MTVVSEQTGQTILSRCKITIHSYTAGDDLTRVTTRLLSLLLSFPVRGTAKKSPLPASCTFFFSCPCKEESKVVLNPEREVDSSQELQGREGLRLAHPEP